ncbi:BolA family protein [Thalassotalea mangrovi]|uniref:BolA family transcriptional regulator n=1 Tax=Thalassotalea mangrovi TaxID=2572245 RepID=A0A4U1BBD9_9GAMM|nr:BolA family protein [Thalassotalea mangrovi]TKB47902.1 BolA family transcriptional regulator [Thalassotalea mangrovi]
MQAADIEKILNDALNLDELHVTFDGSQCSIIAVADSFADMSRVKKQQTVYAPLTEAINQGHIHAVSIKTFTNSQWQREKKFILPS